MASLSLAGRLYRCVLGVAEGEQLGGSTGVDQPHRLYVLNCCEDRDDRHPHVCNEGPEIMKYACVTFVALLFCTGCGRDQLPSESVVPEDAPAVTSERSLPYPQVHWAEPEPDQPNVIAVGASVGPANIATVRRRFTEGSWTKASKPRFAIWLTENDFFEITIDPDSTKMVGTVRTTRTIDSGPLRGERISETRTTQPLANEDEALALLEAYIKQDGAFDTLVQWSNSETGGSIAGASERSP